jgi:hypothetical protein
MAEQIKVHGPRPLIALRRQFKLSRGNAAFARLAEAGGDTGAGDQIPASRLAVCASIKLMRTRAAATAPTSTGPTGAPSMPCRMAPSAIRLRW